MSVALMPGDEIHGFVLESIDVLDDYHGYGYFFRHRMSGMEVYHVANDDTENLFAFIFKTPPVNDCGTPHIIEHCILAGSKRYPVRDPFMSLLKGSANTFMNAMTYPDYTVYPAASPLKKDFENLFSVYADAVFNPLLREETFWQEGIRIDATEDGSLNFGGVVFNEMLGELSDHDSIVGRQSIRSLFPDTPYFYESGGDPQDIIKLDYRQFVGYYASHYHPSNCRLFLYGNQDIDERLSFLDEQYLADISSMNASGPTSLAKPWTKPKTVVTTSPADGDSVLQEDATVAISWSTSVVEDPLEVLTLSVLTDILLGNPGAPLYKAIIDSQLAKDISQVSGMDTSFRQLPFTVGFKGIDPDKAQQAQQLVLDTLKAIVDEGIPKSLVLNAIKRQEFLLQEPNGDIPMGLRAMNRAVRGWLQGQKPHVTISVAPSLEKLKELVGATSSPEGTLFSSDGYFEQWIEKHLLDNPHRCLLVVKPDANHKKRLEAAIEQRLDEVKEKLGKDGMEILRQQSERFSRFEEQRDTPEDLATIPKLLKEDLPETIRNLPQQLVQASTVPLYLQSMETNGIVYLDGMFSVGDLDEEEQLLLPLFTRLLHMSGVDDLSYDQVAVKLRQSTGGLHLFLENSSMAQSTKTTRSGLAFRLKCLQRDQESAFSILSDILQRANVDDPERIGAVLNDLISDYESNVSSSGQMYASQRASANFSSILKQNEMWNGLDQWLHLVGIERNHGEVVKAIGISLKALQRRVVDRGRLALHLCASPDDLHESEISVQRFVESFPESQTVVMPVMEIHDTQEDFGQSLEVFRIPSSVSFSALVCRAADPFSPIQSHQAVLAHILTTNHLWEQVRGVGGAYGVSAHIDMLERLCVFSSYRDPRVDGTLQDFRSVLERIAQDGVDQELVDLAIISIISRELRPLYPKQASMIAFRRALYGITDAFRAERRAWTLETTVDDVKVAAAELLRSMDQKTSAVVIAGQEILEREAAMSERMRVEAIKLPL
ncbi:insulinase family protein [Pleomorphochaeta sp. DL1XJH-081]|uniref:insulinase family protein n=1 Tax=Pleomorphochaeta sp. DL1XJH-081 TaxID=3409690 RepID=UPI003BB60CCA